MQLLQPGQISLKLWELSLNIAQNPQKLNWLLQRDFFCFLKGTADMSLMYNKSENTHVVEYSDADYAAELDDR